MSPIPTLLGAALALSVFLAVTGLVGVNPEHLRPQRRAVRSRTPGATTHALAASGAGALALGITGWVVGAVLAALGVFFLPRLFGASEQRAAGIERTEAVAAWAAMLQADMAGAAGIEEALAATAGHPPEPIAAEVAELAASLRHQPLEDALRAFAERVGDPCCDQMVTALGMAARGFGRDLGVVLASLGKAAEDDATGRDEVDTSRTRSYTSGRIISAVTVVVAAGLLLLGGDYMDSFDGAEGQVVLLLAGGVFAASLAGLARMGETEGFPAFGLAIPDEEGAP